MSFVTGRINKGKEKVKFFTQMNVAWSYVAVHDQWLMLNGIPVHQEGKSVTMVPGQMLETDDVDVIKFFRENDGSNGRGKIYGLEVLEVGVHTKTDSEVAKLKGELSEVDKKIERAKENLSKVQVAMKKEGPE